MNLKPLLKLAKEKKWSKQKLKSVRGQVLKMDEEEARRYMELLFKLP